ncbi:hypothetical protein FRB98_008392 [Tulasnella sp. 332]|nr:hypothetical protein FRB98_008392 [Tulasnella sp. 332]
MNCSIDSLLFSLPLDGDSVRSNAALEAAYCAYTGSDVLGCLGVLVHISIINMGAHFAWLQGICPNTDVAGIGVRSAFYFNSIANALLVAVSPSDAAAGAWSSTILTAALIGPALLQKAWQNMTLHHAYIVAALGTLSAVSSLATAPMVPIWRGGKQATRLDAVDYSMDKAESERGRVVLAFALIIQIVLVFAWVTFLFVNPQYSQQACSGETVLVWPGGKQLASYVDEYRYWAWSLWLLSYAAITFVFGVVLVFSCQSEVHDMPDQPRMRFTGSKSRWERWWAARPRLVPEHDEHYRVRVAIRASKWIAGIIVVSYAVMAEVQIAANKTMILPGESNIWSFSQAAAVMLSIAPLWPLAMAYSEKRNARLELPTSSPRRPIDINTPSSPPLQSPTLSPPLIRTYHPRRSNEGSDFLYSSSNNSEGEGEGSPSMSRPNYINVSGGSSIVELPLLPLSRRKSEAGVTPYLTITGPPSDEFSVVSLEASGREPVAPAHVSQIPSSYTSSAMSSANPNPTLFTPLQLGDIKLQHRIILAPMTRFRANDAHVHEEIAAEYYGQRASAGGLLITEATFISEEAGGYPHVPGIWNEAQISAWKIVTERVHAKGGFIYLQLWALGRAAYPTVLAAKGLKYVSAGDIPTPVLEGELGPAPTPLSREDIERYVETYRQAAKNAVHGAGFDGVEVVKAVTDAVGQEKTGIRLSPHSLYNGMRMEDDLLVPQFEHIITCIRDLYPRFAYMHLTEPRVRSGNPFEISTGEPGGGSLTFARDAWGQREGSPFITCGAYTRDRATETVEAHGGAVAFARAFLANPDLPLRLKYNLSLTEWDRSTFYSLGPNAIKGYTDYPFTTELISDADI